MLNALGKRWCRILPCVVFALGLVLSSRLAWAQVEAFQQAGMPDEILFAVHKPSLDGHWYANIGWYAYDLNSCPFPKNSGGKLCIYNVKTKQVRTIFEDPHGNIRDPQIHYDGTKLIFSYLPAGKHHYSLYEINIDGTNLRQITGKGEDVPRPGEENLAIYAPPGWDDFEPTYLPDGGIAFCSTRCHRYVQCWLTQVGVIYRCDADGSNIRQLSANVEQDNTPWVLSNGQILYMRWEYVDRYHMAYHHLWTMNPDGTRQMVFYGNQMKDGVFLGAKPIPGDPDRVIGTYSPGHGMHEHYGRIAIFDPQFGPDDPAGITYLSKKNTLSDPWPFDAEHVLVASYSRLVMLGKDGVEETLYELPEELAKQGFMLNEPRPVMKHEREPVLADTTDPTKDYGTFALLNLYEGRRMKDVPQGTVKELLIYEVLPKPISYSGASEVSSGGTFSIERLIGSVPVSPEGSAYFNVPALRSLLFVAMDEHGHCVKRMHSFTSVMPGEVTVCIGCHEDRQMTPGTQEGERLNALLRLEPAEPKPVAGVPEIFDFPRDIQPILDEHCLKCHNHDQEDGGFNISGDWGPLYTIGYQQMSWRELFGDNRDIVPYEEHIKSDFQPYEIGSGSSHLLKLVEEGHQGVNMPEAQQKMLRYWLDAGANYAGTYAVNSAGEVGSFVHNVNQREDRYWPEAIAMNETISRRCDGCHAPTEAEKKIGKFDFRAQYYGRYYPADVHQKNHYIAHWISEDNGRYNRHEIFNLSYPEKSKVLRAPLAKSAGGLGVCEAKSGKPVFADTNDPDYQVMLAAVQRGRRYILEESNRFSMAVPSVNNGADCPVRFVPRPDYVREMIRYGVLPADWDFSTPVDPYELDQKYWKSLWYTPPKQSSKTDSQPPKTDSAQP